MRYQKAFYGILFSIIVTATIFMGLSAISQKGTDQRAFMVLQHETMPVTSDAATVPNWSEINHTKLAIDTQDALAPHTNVSYGGAGVSVPIGGINSTHNKAFSLNATNLQPYMNLSYTDRFTIICTDQFAASNFTVRLYSPLINATQNDVNQTLISNAKAIRIRSATNETSFAFTYATIFNTTINPSVYPMVTKFAKTQHFFEFNISKAANVFESRGLLNGDSFLFEVNYTIPVKFSSWGMSMKAAENFRIEGNQATRRINYNLSFHVLHLLSQALDVLLHLHDQMSN